MYFPEKKMMDEVKEEQLEKGVDINQINKEQLDFAMQMISNYKSDLIYNLNKQVSTGIKELAMNQQWPNLSAIAKDCYDNIDKIKNQINLPENINQLHSLKKEVLYMSIPNIKEMFKESYIKENFPELLKERKLK